MTKYTVGYTQITCIGYREQKSEETGLSKWAVLQETVFGVHSNRASQKHRKKKKWGEITDGILKCIVARPFSSHWMVESIAFAKAKHLQTLFLKVCVSLKRNKSSNLMYVRKQQRISHRMLSLRRIPRNALSQVMCPFVCGLQVGYEEKQNLAQL